MKKKIIESKIKTLVIDRGYNSLAHFSDQERVSYYLLRKLASNEALTFDVPFLIEVCQKLDCEIGDLLVLAEPKEKKDVKEDKQ